MSEPGPLFELAENPKGAVPRKKLDPYFNFRRHQKFYDRWASILDDPESTPFVEGSQLRSAYAAALAAANQPFYTGIVFREHYRGETLEQATVYWGSRAAGIHFYDLPVDGDGVRKLVEILNVER